MAKKNTTTSLSETSRDAEPATQEVCDSQRNSEPDRYLGKNEKKGHVMTAPPASTELAEHELWDSQKQSLTAIETMVGHELSLVSSRMTWFVISQSFLFGAYATITTDPVRMSVFDPKNTDPGFGAFTTQLIVFAVPVVGLLIAFAAHRSVKAAGLVLDDLLSSRGRILESLNTVLKKHGLEQIPVIGDCKQRSARLSTTIRDGELPLWLLPMAMAIVWITVLAVRID